MDKPSLNPLKKDGLSVRNIGKPKVAFLFAVLLLKSQFYYPVRTKDKMHAIFFSSHSHCFRILGVQNKIHLANQINRTGNTLLTVSHEIINPV